MNLCAQGWCLMQLACGWQQGWPQCRKVLSSPARPGASLLLGCEEEEDGMRPGGFGGDI